MEKIDNFAAVWKVRHFFTSLEEKIEIRFKLGDEEGRFSFYVFEYFLFKREKFPIVIMSQKKRDFFLLNFAVLGGNYSIVNG